MSTSTSLFIKNGTIVSSEGEKQSDILIENGIISKIQSTNKTINLSSRESETIDASGLVLFPGLIDCHVHFREPGLEHKETMATGAAAALAGGVTTVCEMPNTIPPTVTVAALADKVRRSEKLTVNSEKIKMDLRFFFGATEPAHLITLQELWTGSSAELQRLKKRCCGLKLYLDHSTGNQKAPGGVIDDAFSMCAELNIPVVCHCEDPDINQAARTKYQNPKDIADHSRMRPPESEEKAMKDALALAKKYGTHLHIAHLSTKGGLDLIRAAKKAGVTVTCEVAPHHLFLTVDDYAALGTLAKMNPPLRTREHQEALWEGIADGTVDCISTDHAPHTLEEKNCDNPLKAPSGVPGTETMLPLLLSAAAGHWPHVASEKIFSILNSPPAEALAKVGQFSISDIARLCFENPNRIFNLGKQGIVEGATADFILVDPKKEWVIKGKELHSKCGWTPYEGWKVAGRVVRVVQS